MYNGRYNRKYNTGLASRENLPAAGELREALAGRAGGPAYQARGLGWKYDIQPYNRIPKLQKVPVVAPMAEYLAGRMALGSDLHLAARLQEQLRGKGLLAQGVRLRLGLAEELAGSAHGFTAVRIYGSLGEALGGKARFDADLYVLSSFSESLGGALRAGADLYVLGAVEETLAGALPLSADIYLLRGLYETLNGYAGVGHVSEAVTDITKPIPPGGVLIIDADNYNVLLDGRDAIASHRGDWVHLGRPSVFLTLSSVGSRSFTWEVFYVARYL